MKEKENIFTRELEVFRVEAHLAIQFFYAYEAINDVLKGNKRALDLVNESPLFWQTISDALQTSFFITVGRIFDQGSMHNVDKLLGVAQDQSVIFSASALEARKRKGSANAEEWIVEYMKDVHIPTADDFRRLRRHVSNYRKIYESRYRVLRNKVYAHKELSNPEDVKTLYAKTNIRELQKLSTFLNRLSEALWELFQDGRKPILRPMKYSVVRMRKAEIPEWQITDVQERMVDETEKFFGILSTASNPQVREWRGKNRVVS